MNTVHKTRSLLMMGLIGLISVLTAAAPGTVHADGGFAKVGSTTGTMEKIARSPRSEALGGADMALATGPFAILNNAAPLPSGDETGLGYGFFKYVSIYNFDFLGAFTSRGPWRFSALAMAMKSDSILVRTAYLQEGDGTTFQFENNFLLLNTSYDLASVVAPQNRNLQWTIGLGWRYHELQIPDDSRGGWDMDLGTSARLTRAMDRGRFEISGSAMLRNFADQTIDFDDETTPLVEEATLPRFRDFGLALALFGYHAEHPGDELQFRLMVSSRKDQNRDEDGFFGDVRIGAELTLFEILALRAGSDNGRIIEEKMSYGIGLTLPERYSGSFILRYDYAKLNNDDSVTFVTIDGDRDLHSFTVQNRF